MGILSKKFTCYQLVDVWESNNTWAGYPTYLFKYEDCRNRGHYVVGEFLPSVETQKEIEEALAELEYQAQGLEFPDQDQILTQRDKNIRTFAKVMGIDLEVTK